MDSTGIRVRTCGRVEVYVICVRTCGRVEVYVARPSRDGLIAQFEVAVYYLSPAYTFSALPRFYTFILTFFLFFFLFFQAACEPRLSCLT